MFAILRGADGDAAVQMAGANGLHGAIAMVATRSGSAVRAGGVPREIKAVIQWRSVQWLREIGVRPTGGRFAIALPVAQSHVPFADDASAIPHVAQHGRYCGTIRLDQGITLCAEEHPPFHPTAPRVTTGEQSITRGRAAAGRRVRVGETHPHALESLHLRRVQLHGIRVASEILIRTRVSHAHVIGHEENDVGLRCGISRMERQCSKE